VHGGLLSEAPLWERTAFEQREVAADREDARDLEAA
jgi:hypothetical protein